jgi:Domain of unknown function (DUF4160)
MAGLDPAIQHVRLRERIWNITDIPVRLPRRRKEPVMPTVAYFYGIAVAMFYDDHNPPHFHAKYGRAKALVRIADGEILAGDLPPTARSLVRDWALARRSELEENWRRAMKHEELERIAGPDGQG